MLPSISLFWETLFPKPNGTRPAIIVVRLYRPAGCYRRQGGSCANSTRTIPSIFSNDSRNSCGDIVDERVNRVASFETDSASKPYYLRSENITLPLWSALEGFRLPAVLLTYRHATRKKPDQTIQTRADMYGGVSDSWNVRLPHTGRLDVFGLVVYDRHHVVHGRV